MKQIPSSLLFFTSSLFHQPSSPSFGRKRGHKAIVGMGQADRQVVHLLLHACNHHQRFDKNSPDVRCVYSSKFLSKKRSPDPAAEAVDVDRRDL